MDQWSARNQAPSQGWDTSHDTSQPGDAGSIRTWIMHALGRLEMGQHLNRQAGAEQVQSLHQHINTRFTDIGRRMDRIEDRLGVVETRPPQISPDAPSSRPSHQPWWQEMSLRERLIWVLVFLAFPTAWARPDMAGQIISAITALLTGGLVK